MGDVQSARQTLGLDMPVIVYRMFECSLRDVLEKEFSEEYTDELFRTAGKQSGIEFAKHALKQGLPLQDFITNLQRTIRSLDMGILKIEKLDKETLGFIFTLTENLDTSGTPMSGKNSCAFTEGFFSGIFEHYFNRSFNVKEIECVGNGDSLCRFIAIANT
jgi:predicted hydrocarbon binding protein